MWNTDAHALTHAHARAQDELNRRYSGDDDVREVMRGLGASEAVEGGMWGAVTRQEWRDYYAGRSALVPTNTMFEELVSEAWGVPSGTTARGPVLAGGTCVLATHLDGTQSVECIDQDDGASEGRVYSQEELLKALRHDGVWDAVSATHLRS